MLILVFILFGLSIPTGIHFYRRIYNPISVYGLIWLFMIALYEWRLMRYPDIRMETWIIITAAFFSFLAGTVFFHFYRKAFPVLSVNNIIEEEPWYHEKKYLIFIIYLTGIIGLLGAVQHWLVLFREFGSLINIMLNASKIYRMRVAGELEGMLPYVTSFLNISLFFSGLYTARTGKLSAALILSFSGIILADLAQMGREGMLFGLFQFISIIWLYGIASKRHSEKRSLNWKLIASFTIIIVLAASSATLVKSLRSGRERFRGASSELNRLQSGTFISPSIYLYFSSHIPLFDKYLNLKNEEAMWGENTFLPFYNIMAKTGIVNKPGIYQKGYYVPVWTNTGTYLREVHADFGLPGIFIVPFIIGALLSYFWTRFKESGRMNYFVPLVYIFIILQMSFLMMITRSAKWWISMILIYAIINAGNILDFFQINRITKPVSNE